MKANSMTRGVSLSSPQAGRWTKTSAYYVAYIIIGIWTAILGPTLPELAKKTGSLLGDMSILFTARSLGYLAGAFVVGRWYDRGAGHRLMVVTLAVTAGLLALVPVAPALWTLTMLMLLLGLTISMVDVGANTFLVWVHREKVAPYMTGLHFFFGVGAFLAPLLVAQVLLRYDDISWSFWFLSLLILPAALWLFLLPNPKPQHLKAAVEEPMEKTDLKLFVSVILFLLVYMGLVRGYGGWIYSYGLITGLTDKTGAAYLTSVFWGTFTSARLLSIPLTVRIKPISLIFGSIIGSLLSFSLILLFPGSFQVLLLSSAGVGAFMSSIFPTTLSFCERRLKITGKITSWFFVGSSAGAMTLPWIFGQLLERQGAYSMMIAMTATVAGELFILAFIRCLSEARDRTNG
jgi:FHS family Na+ dependent glucose MFS transporter 1